MKTKLRKVFPLLLCLTLCLCSIPGVWVLKAYAAASSDSFLWPTTNKRINVLDHYSSGAQHGGIDINASSGSPVYAVASGNVVRTGNDCSHSSAGAGHNCYASDGWGEYGNYIVLQHSIGGTTYTSVYAHLTKNSLKCSVGDQVSAGQEIASSGSSGSSTGPHLHLEIYEGVFRGSIKTNRSKSFQYYQNNAAVLQGMTFSSHMNTSSEFFGAWIEENCTLTNGVWKYTGSVSPVQQYLDLCTSSPCNYILTIKTAGQIMTIPINNIESRTVETTTVGDTYSSTVEWINTYNETWYEVTCKNGQRGFIGGSSVTLSQPPSNLSISGHEGNPGTPTGILTPGLNYGLRGIISSNYNITYIEAHIYDSNNQDANNTTAYHTNWSSKSYNIQTDGINNHFSFRLLEEGNYRYVVSAQDSSGTYKRLINSQFTVGSGATEQKSVFDLNGWLDGNLSWGNIEGYGTVDVYINGSLAASNVSDYCAEHPVGTSYEIRNIRALDGHQYDGIHSGSLAGTIGTERVEVYLSFSKLSYLNLDGFLDGMANDGLGAYGVVDVYINGNLVAEGWTDYWEAWPAGTTYEIKNIRANEGYQYNGVHSGSLSGTIGTERVNVVLSFSSLVNLNLDGFLDGSKYDSLNDYGTADIYINGSLVASGCSDYWEAWPTGTTYEIKNIIANPGYHYNGVYSGSLSGTIGTERVNVVLSFGTNTSGLCGDKVSWRLEDDKLFIEGTGSMYDYFYYPPWYSSRLSIKEAIISNGVTTIGNDTCHYCTNLVNVSIPDSVTSIGVSAFSECSSLTSIKIPENVTRIGDYAFYYCESLTGIQIPNNVSYIGEWAFVGCTNLKSVTIPDTVSYIGTYAFFGCDSLTSVVIPSLVTSIGEYTFSGCSSMESVTIPNNVRSIDHHAFKSCSCLRDVYYMGTEAQWKLIAISSDNESLTSATIHYLTEPDFILPAALTEIDEEAFAGGAFTYAHIPDGTMRIERRAFADCPNLKDVDIPASATSIDPTAFADTSGLTIHGTDGSFAEFYANKYGFGFVAIQ